MEALARDQLHHRPQPVHRYYGDLADRVHRDAAPMRPTDVRRQHERPAHARRREDPFVAESVDRRVTGGAVRLARAPHAVLGEAMGAERRRHGGEWLRGIRLLAGNVARWDRTLLHRENRLTGLAVEDEQHAGLRGLDDGGGWGARVAEPDTRRGRGDG